MKRILFALLLLLVTASSFAAIESPGNPTPNLSTYNFFKTLHFSGTVHLSGGCTVTYNLTLVVGLFPPSFGSLTGTLNMSGNCVGVQSISITGKSDVTETPSLSESAELKDFEINETIFTNVKVQKELNQALQNIFNAVAPFTP